MARSKSIIIPESSATWEDAFAKFHVPEQFHRGLKLFLTAGIRPGGYLSALLQNDAMQAAVAVADTAAWLGGWAVLLFLVHEAPGNAWGSQERFEGWMKSRHQERAEPDAWEPDA